MSSHYLSIEELSDTVRVKTGIDVTAAGESIESQNMSDLGIDSLGWLGVIAQLENVYRISLDSSAEQVTNLAEMVALVNKILYSGTGFMPGHTENSIVIDAPFDLVWSMTNDVNSWPDLFSEYAEAEIIDRQGDTIMFRLTTRPDEMSAVYSWVSERTVNRAERIVKAHRVETGIFRFMYITWIYSDVPGGTEMRWVQDFAMKPDAPAIEQATNYINHNSVVQMTRIKGLVEAASAAGEA